MSKIPVFSVLVFSVGAALGVSGFDTTITREPPLLRDGFVLRGVDGKLSGPDSDGAWYFEIASDVNDYRAIVEAGTKLELLPSSALEKMTADAKMRGQVTYRLWNGRVTRYKGRNFIFATFFLPLSPVKKPEPKRVFQKLIVGPSPSEKPQGTKAEAGDVGSIVDADRQSQGALQPGEARATFETPSKMTAELQQEQIEPVEAPPAAERDIEPIVRDPNDVLTIPPDILEKLRARREEIGTSIQPVVDGNGVSVDDPNLGGEEQEQPTPVHYSRGADSVFVDRTAMLVGQTDGQLVFSLDALGRNIQQLSLRLLPCEVLELAEQKRSAELERVRFKIAGILTRYEGQDYLLLQKATQTYSHGNFGR